MQRYAGSNRLTKLSIENSEEPYFCNWLTSERDDQGQTGDLYTFDQLDTLGFELGNENFFHSLMMAEY